MVYISGINRGCDSQTHVGMTKLVVAFQENLLQYVFFERAFDLPSTLLKAKK